MRSVRSALARVAASGDYAAVRARIVFWGTVFGVVLFALTATAFAQPSIDAASRANSPRPTASRFTPTSPGRKTTAPHVIVAPSAGGPGGPAAARSTTPVDHNPPRNPAFRPRQFTVLGAGDVLLHPGFWRQAKHDAQTHHVSGYDFDPIFTSAVPDIKGADLAICHMETPYGKPDGPFTGYPIFEVPPQIAGTLHRIGYDTCSTASNHSLDGGQAGIVRTLDALDAAGVKHTGTARSAKEAATPDILDVNGVKVAQLSYAYGFNGLIRPAGKPWLANLIKVPDILAAAHRAKQAGAEVVIVSLHFGTEYRQTPNAQQTAVAKALLASPDVDLILGCHAHVVQPFQEINGKWVVYGMGNQVAEQSFSRNTMDGVMARFTFTEVRPHVFRVTKAEAIPTYTDLDHPQRLIDLPRALGTPGLSSAKRAAYQASWNRTAKEVKSRHAKDLIVVG